MRTGTRWGALVAGALAIGGVAGCSDVESPVAPGEPAMQRGRQLTSTVADFLSLSTGPVAIAHRGMGPNRGEDPTRPIENTVEAVRRGYETGAAVVEVDLQMTADGEVVAWHEDFLPDHTCFNTLTRAELAARAPYIDSFQAVLQTARRYNQQSPGLGGLLTVDLKPASPLCDPADIEGEPFVDAVIRTIRLMNATELIFFNSMSPVILGMAAQKAPEIPRQLTVLLLQLLSQEQVEAATGLPVTEIVKTPSYGLRWAEVGPIHRLPAYASPAQAIGIAHAVGARIISFDLMLLGFLEQSSPGQGLALVNGAKATGLTVMSGDVSTAAHWMLGAALGVHALYADNVPLAVGLQPPLN